MGNLLVVGFNSKMNFRDEKVSKRFNTLLETVVKLSDFYDKVVVNLSSSLEINLFNRLVKYFRENYMQEKLGVADEMLELYTEKEYNNRFSDIKEMSKERRHDIIISRSFMDNGYDILMINDTSNNDVIDAIIEYAKSRNVHSYAVDLMDIK